MVYCPNCGNPNDDSTKFCIKCGHSLAVRPEGMGPAQKQPGGRGGIGRTLLIGLFALVVVGVLAVVVYFLAQGVGSGEGWIAYRTRESDGTLNLWVVRPDIEEPIEVVSGVDMFQLALVFQSERQFKATLFAPKGNRMLFATEEGREFSLYTYVLGEDDAERIVRQTAPLSFGYSPDGERITVQVYEEGERSLLLMDTDGENEHSLLEEVEGWAWVLWLPNGRELAVGLYGQGEYSLLLTDDQGEEQQTLVDEMGGMQFNVSLNGDRIAYAVEEDGEWDIYVADADGSDATRIEKGLEYLELIGLSPDGKQLLTRASSNAYSWDLYLVETDGTGQVTLARDADEADGGFCPDGKRIWFAVEEDGEESLYLADADGEDEVLVERRIDDWEMEFTPDGRTMVVGLEKGGDWDLLAVDVATGEMVELFSSADDLGPLIVMANKRVLFSAADGGDWSLYVARLDREDLLELAGPVDGFAGYDASPDGRKVVYSEERSTGYRLYLIDADGENQEMLADDGVGPIWSD